MDRQRKKGEMEGIERWKVGRWMGGGESGKGDQVDVWEILNDGEVDVGRWMGGGREGKKTKWKYGKL